MEHVGRWACLRASFSAWENGGGSHFGMGAEINSGLSNIGLPFPGRKLSRFLDACLLSVWLKTGLVLEMAGAIGSAILAGLWGIWFGVLLNDMSMNGELEDERLDAPFVVVRETEISSLNSCSVSSLCDDGEDSTLRIDVES